LIYKSQTACYAKDREKAIDDLGDFDCQCNPEILTAMVYALNDADEEVREEAADELGDQFEKNCCCCSPEITAALTCALADCDRGVRRQAEEALEKCGYEVVDGCCDSCCSTSSCCSTGCGSAPKAAPANAAPTPAAPAEEAAPAPAPPEEPKAYFPSRLNKQQTRRPTQRKNRLANLFGFRN
jgi:HEAT repeats